MVFERNFDNLTEEDVQLLDSYFDGYDYNSSGHTFVANYIWRNTHHITWQIIGDYLCMAGMGTLETEEETYFMAFPLTRTGEYDPDKLKETLLAAKRIFDEKQLPFEISMIPGTLALLLKEIFGDDVVLHHDRDDDDYIYLKDSLVTLSGRKLHQKKNHLNYFKRTWEYSYEEITPENVDEVMAFIESVNADRLDDTHDDWKEILELETEAIRELLSLVGSKRLLTGLIRIEGKVEAVTIGEFAKTNSREKVLVHVEKANTAFRGLYQAINNEFCKRLPEETLYVNREEDMGMENLRYTKMSYRPAEMGEKYSAILK